MGHELASRRAFIAQNRSIALSWHLKHLGTFPSLLGLLYLVCAYILWSLYRQISTDFLHSWCLKYLFLKWNLNFADKLFICVFRMHCLASALIRSCSSMTRPRSLLRFSTCSTLEAKGNPDNFQEVRTRTVLTLVENKKSKGLHIFPKFEDNINQIFEFFRFTPEVGGHLWSHDAVGSGRSLCISVVTWEVIECHLSGLIKLDIFWVKWGELNVFFKCKRAGSRGVTN